LLVKDWIPVKLPTLLLVNTFVLLLSSLGMELARRQFRGKQFLRPRRSSENLFDRAEQDALARHDSCTRTTLPVRAVDSLETARRLRFLCFLHAQQFVCLFIDGDACRSFDGRDPCAVRCQHRRVIWPGFGEARIVIDVTAWYWHFMAGLWVYILCLLEFAR